MGGNSAKKKTAKKSDPKLWEKVKKEITRSEKGGNAGQWSARKAQMATQEYKARGGGYEGPRQEDTHLNQWTREEWDTKSGRKGRQHSSQPKDIARKTARHRGDESNRPTKSELYEQAKKRDIPGRSKMSKAQLEKALG